MDTFMFHFGGGSHPTYPSMECLTFALVGVISILIGILINIVYVLYVKYSQGSGNKSISWNNIKPTVDNTFLGGLFGFIGFAFILIPLVISLLFIVYKFLITI